MSVSNDTEKAVLDMPSTARPELQTMKNDSSDEQESRDGNAATKPRDIHGLKWVTVVAAILSSVFLFAIDNTITADIQPEIVLTYNDISKLSWISIAFLLSAASTNLTWARLYGNFERKSLYILTIVMFEAGSAVCGAAPTMNALIVGRAICGLGGVGMYLGVMSLLSATTTTAERPIYLAMTAVVWGLGTVLGPFIGGAFTDSSATWRWGFYINLCVGGLFSPVYLFLIPRSDPRPGASFSERFLGIDWIGTVLLAGAMTTLIMAIAFGGVIYAWNSGSTIALFVISGVLFVVFGIQQAFSIFTTEEIRIFPIPFLKSKELVIQFIEIASAGTISFIPIYYIPLLFQLAWDESALSAGVRLLPYILLLVSMNMINGYMMGAFGYYMHWFTCGSILSIIGTALLYTVKRTTSISTIYGYTVITGIGVGAFSQASFAVAQVLVEPEMIPMAIGFISSAQIGGAAIGLAIGNAVFLNTAQNSIYKLLLTVPLAEVQELISGAGSSLLGNLSAETQSDVTDLIVSSIDKTFILAIAAGALALVLSVFMDRGKLKFE